MGALSARARNAQVALYQSGEVDYLVATDAIGMGLNLDIDHVAFSARNKFDERTIRPLSPPELAQIAGRAGRYMRPGNFGVTGEVPPLDAALAEAISNNEFPLVEKLNWRNGWLEFGTLGRLIGALEAQPADRRLQRGRAADDLMALKTLAARPEIQGQLRQPQDIRRCGMCAGFLVFEGFSGPNIRPFQRKFSLLWRTARACLMIGSLSKSGTLIAWMAA